MKNSILSIVFIISFIITGCGIDSIFEGGAVQWGISALILIIVAWVLFGGKDEY